MHAIICSMKIRFSEESLNIATSADKLMQFDYEKKLIFGQVRQILRQIYIDINNLQCKTSYNKIYFQDILNINKNEMSAFKNVLVNNIIDFNCIKENVNIKIFSNIYGMVQVAITSVPFQL